MTLLKRFRRRQFLLASGTFAIASSCSRLANSHDFNPSRQVLETAAQHLSASRAPLKQRAAAKGLLYGSLGRQKELAADPDYAAAISRECSTMVTRFYWRITHPEEQTFDFTETDYCLNFASEHQMRFSGHPLVWHQSNPDWLVDKFKDSQTRPQEVEQILTSHISTVVGRYAGQIYAWNVVNEAVKPEDGRADGLRDTQESGVDGERYPTWLHFLGTEYIDVAFRAAAAADPAAMLVYNDYGLSHGTAEVTAKRAAVLRLLKQLKSIGTPIHALGIQGHLDGNKPIDQASLRDFLREVADLGLKILITELDVTDQDLPADVESRDRRVASVYEDYLSVVLDEPAVVAVLTWGLSDRYTWISWKRPRSDGEPVRPLPLDAELEPKLAWAAMARAFDNTPNH